MTTVVPCSTKTTLIIGAAFTIKKKNHLTRCSLRRKSATHTLSSQGLVLPLLTSVGLFPQSGRDSAWLRRSVVDTVSAAGTETDVVIEEPDSPVADEDSSEASEILSDAVEKIEKSSIRSGSNPAPAQSKHSRPSRKSEMPPVSNENLVPGAAFTGKVKSIQPFGAFVDFGAFTDGLVHVSRLSDNFVKDVGSVVAVGQEVTVRLVEANMETGRISLTMRESDDKNKLQQQKDAPSTSSGDKPRGARRNTPKPSQRKEDFKTSKFVKGQELKGTVKNLTRAGAFISFSEGDEGFLPQSEESNDGFANMMGGSSLEVGQEVSVRVLRVTRGQVTLTMKKGEDNELDLEFSQGVVHAATNPFVLAFRNNKDIAAFLDEREKMTKKSEKPKSLVEVEEQVNQTETTSNIAEVLGQPLSSDGGSVSVPSTSLETIEKDELSAKEGAVGSSGTSADEEQESTETSSSKSVEGAVQTVEKEAEENSRNLNPEGSVSDVDKVIEEAPSNYEGMMATTPDENSSITDLGEQAIVSPPEAKDEKETIEDSEQSGSTSEAEILSSESQNIGEAVENLVENASNEVQIEASTSEAEIPSAIQIENEKVETAPEKNAAFDNSNGQSYSTSPENVTKGGEETVKNSKQSGSTSAAGISSSESQDIGEVVENQAENASNEVQIEASASEAEIPPGIQIENEKVEPATEKSAAFDNSNGQSNSTSPERMTKATISPALVKQLREETGAGMMDCKKALSETGGDIVKAQEFLRKKGLASAEKKASRATAEGRIGSYIHDNRIGVLIEVNCETDFVSRGDIFKELVDDLAMQVAACPQVQHLVTEDVPEEIVNKEREIEMQKEDLLSKPEQIRSKIVEGRIRKRLEELALLEQPYIKNDKIVVKDWVKQTIATIGENIKLKRFVRYNLGEGLEKKSQDFAAEVAAQTAAKPVAAPAKERPASAEANETASKPAVTVSAALVKQLREETGAGMMDCKKALSETGGDLEKAQEYLRKKGLSTADKKSSRLAAEGRISAYIHDSRIGVLIEVNSETDFVGRSEKFKELVDDLAMQVVACPQVQFVSIEDIPESIVKKEKELEMQREDLLSKPEKIREKIVEGRVSKRLGELALLEQPFIKNDSVLVKDLVKQTVAALGENIKVRRFVRFTLGETIEDTKTETEA